MKEAELCRCRKRHSYSYRHGRFINHCAAVEKGTAMAIIMGGLSTTAQWKLFNPNVKNPKLQHLHLDIPSCLWSLQMLLLALMLELLKTLSLK